MPMMKILFLHDWQSIPGGVKPTVLAQQGHEVINPALPDEDMEMAVRIAQAEFDKHQPDVVVGPSRQSRVSCSAIRFRSARICRKAIGPTGRHTNWTFHASFTAMPGNYQSLMM